MFEPSLRLPDPCIEVLDERFLALRLFSASVERLATGLRWAEGPVWFGDGRFLLFSDIPNDRILRWDDCSGALAEFRRPSQHANGLARDRQGRLLACEHGTRRVTRTVKETMSLPAEKVAGSIGTLKVRMTLDTTPTPSGTAGAELVVTYGGSLKMVKMPLSAVSVLPLRSSSTRIM